MTKLSMSIINNYWSHAEAKQGGRCEISVCHDCLSFKDDVE